MTHRERIASIYAGKTTDRQGFWLGEPHSDLYPALLSAVDAQNDEDLRRKIDDDCRWVAPDWSCYRHPERRPVFDIMHGMGAKTHHGQPGCFADCVDTHEVDKYPWPDAKHLDLNHYRSLFVGKEDCWRMGGTWGHFFHLVMDFFGLENYFMKMYTDPVVVHAVTRHVVDFFVAANERILTECGDLIDVVFFGNDFGTQEDLFISPEMFKEFVLPYFKELINQAKRFNKPVQLHSCGAISRAIPWLIDAGIDALHPLQARARHMDGCALAKQFKGQLVFVGGIDTQDLMCNGTPQQVKDEVKRLRDVFGARWIISPSHEKLLPEVPISNIIALCEAATGVQLTSGVASGR